MQRVKYTQSGFEPGTEKYCAQVEGYILPIELTAVAALAGGCITPPDGIVSWWPGDGNAGDVVGENDGKLMGNLQFTTGMVNEAFLFDGVNDIVTAKATGLPTGASPRTVVFWAKTDPSANDATGFGYGDEASGKGFYVFTAHSAAGGKLTFSSHGPVGITAEYNLKYGQYHHIAVIYGSETTTIYTDGVAITSGEFSINTGISGGACIGGRCYLGEFFTGEIDEVAVWDRVLSAEEVSSIYEAGDAGMCKP